MQKQINAKNLTLLLKNFQTYSKNHFYNLYFNYVNDIIDILFKKYRIWTYNEQDKEDIKQNILLKSISIEKPLTEKRIEFEDKKVFNYIFRLCENQLMTELKKINKETNKNNIINEKLEVFLIEKEKIKQKILENFCI